MQQIHAINFAPFAPRGAFAGPEAAGELCRMQELTGADAVIFCPGAVQTGPFVEEIDFTGRHTTSDEELLAMTQLAHDRGMRVFWKPAVNCLDGTWRARISFFDHDVPCETKWSGWFASYQAFQLHFAALAQQAGADMLILGCEMTQAERREAEWRRLIAAVRSVYGGAVSYNCDKYGEEHVSWWDALDVIASSGYYPIGQIDQNLDRIEPVVQHFQKPFFFAEASTYNPRSVWTLSKFIPSCRIWRFFSARSGLDAVLKIPHDLRKLRSIQGKRAILKPVLIQLRNQGVFCLIGCAVQFVAICQIFQNPKVCRISKKGLIFAGVFRDILNQSFIDLAPGTFDHLSRKDPLHPDMEFLHRQSAQMQPVHLHLSILGRKSFDRNPVFCDLLALILINDAQPFAFVDCLKKRFSYTVHIRLSLRIGFLIVTK